MRRSRLRFHRRLPAPLRRRKRRPHPATPYGKIPLPHRRQLLLARIPPRHRPLPREERPLPALAPLPRRRGVVAHQRRPRVTPASYAQPGKSRGRAPGAAPRPRQGRAVSERHRRLLGVAVGTLGSVAGIRGAAEAASEPVVARLLGVVAGIAKVRVVDVVARAEDFEDGGGTGVALRGGGDDRVDSFERGVSMAKERRGGGGAAARSNTVDHHSCGGGNRIFRREGRSCRGSSIWREDSMRETTDSIPTETTKRVCWILF
mmetsp:Transcript_523/g.1229  ORF Transcript_523/g.1229 Transcript_523/m.1229 type:complete len:261 (-) Transcript_523:83-865(-)